MTICPIAPGIAMRLTAMRSDTEKCRPTPNMSSITPISASCGASVASATNPGVNGPTAMPATRYPTSGGRPILLAMNPKTKAKAKPRAIVEISVIS